MSRVDDALAIFVWLPRDMSEGEVGDVGSALSGDSGWGLVDEGEGEKSCAPCDVAPGTFEAPDPESLPLSSASSCPATETGNTEDARSSAHASAGRMPARICTRSDLKCIDDDDLDVPRALLADSGGGRPLSSCPEMAICMKSAYSLLLRSATNSELAKF